MVIIDGEGAIIDFNPAAESLFGFSKEDGQRAYSVQELYESEAEAEAVAMLLKQGTSANFGQIMDGYRAQLIDQSGQVHPMLITATQLSDQEDSEESIICHFRDVTETEALEQKVREMSRTDFLTGMYNFRQLFESLEHRAPVTMAPSPHPRYFTRQRQQLSTIHYRVFSIVS